MPTDMRLLCLRSKNGGVCPTEPPTRSVLCLGSFDGVHVAHAALLREGVALSHAMGAPCGVLCFFRPPMDYLSSDGGRGMHLTPLREKLSLLLAAGADFVCLLDFAEVRDLSPEDFLDLLSHRVGCAGAACGFNYRFGKGATGDTSHLTARFGRKAVRVLPEMTAEGGTVCATRIRACLLRGDAEEAARLLGRPYGLCTTVTRGKQLGRTLGFPTANQYFLPEALIPAHGVYAALCHTPAGVFPAVANVGCHPTVDDRARVNCETFLMGYAGNLYGVRMRTELYRHLRGEQSFPDVAALTEAIRRDAAKAAAYLREAGLFPPL